MLAQLRSAMDDAMSDYAGSGKCFLLEALDQHFRSLFRTGKSPVFLKEGCAIFFQPDCPASAADLLCLAGNQLTQAGALENIER